MLTEVIFVRLVNSIFTARDIALQADAVLARAQWYASAAQARAEKAESALESARPELVEELEEAKCQVEIELERARVTEAKLENVVARLSVCDLQLHTVTLQVRAAEEWANDAEAIAQMANARVVDAVVYMREAIAKASKMEAAARTIEERAQRPRGGLRRQWSAIKALLILRMSWRRPLLGSTCRASGSAKRKWPESSASRALTTSSLMMTRSRRGHWRRRDQLTMGQHQPMKD